MATSYNVPNDWSETKITLEQYDPPSDWSDTEVILRAGNVSITGQPTDADYTDSVLVKKLTTPSVSIELANGTSIQPKIDLDTNGQILSTNVTSLQATADISIRSDPSITSCNAISLISSDITEAISNSSLTSSSGIPVQAIRYIPDITGQGSTTTILANPIISNPLTTATSTDNITISNTSISKITSNITTQLQILTADTISRVSDPFTTSISEDDISTSLGTSLDIKSELIVSTPKQKIDVNQTFPEFYIVSTPEIASSNASTLLNFSFSKTISNTTVNTVNVFQLNTYSSIVIRAATQNIDSIQTQPNTSLKSIPSVQKSNVFEVSPDITALNLLSAKSKDIGKKQSDIFKSQSILSQSLDTDQTTLRPTRSYRISSNVKDTDVIESSIRHVHNIFSKSLDIDNFAGITGNEIAMYPKAKDDDINKTILNPERHIAFESSDLDDFAYKNLIFSSLSPDAKDIDQSQSLKLNKKQSIESKQIVDKDVSDTDIHKTRSIELINAKDVDITNLNIRRNRYLTSSPVDTDQTSTNTKVIHSFSSNPADLDTSTINTSKIQEIISQSLDTDKIDTSTRKIQHLKSKSIDIDYLPRSLYLPIRFRSLNTRDIDQIDTKIHRLENISISALDSGQSTSQISRVYKPIFTSIDSDSSSSMLTREKIFTPVTQLISIENIETVESGITILVDAPADSVVKTKFKSSGKVDPIYSANGFVTIHNSDSVFVNLMSDNVSNSIAVTHSTSSSLTINNSKFENIYISNSIDEQIVLTNEQLALLTIDNPVSDTLSKVRNPIDGYIQ